MCATSLYVFITLLGQPGPSDAKFSPPISKYTRSQLSFGETASDPMTAPPADTKGMAFPATNGATANSIYLQQTGGGHQESTDVVPTGDQSPLVPVDAKTLASANALIRQSLATPAKKPLPGKPVSLQTAIGVMSGSRQQVNVVRAYWKLSSAMADYHYSVEEAEFLMNLAIPQSTHYEALLTSLQACAKSRQAESRLAAVQAQQDLAGAMPAPAGEDLPLASDVPFVGVYRTHFDALSARGAAPAHLRRIDRALPVVRQLIDSQAAAVFATAEAVKELEQAYEDGRVTFSALLDSHERLRGQRRDFLSAVRSYNERIAEYAFSVSVPGMTLDRMVGMLIEQPRTDRSVLASGKTGSKIKRVANEEPVDLTPQSQVPLR